MITETVFDQFPIWLLFLGTALLLFAGSEIGFRAGAWKNARRAEGDKTPTNAIMGSTLGLLAFMLAFTFGMSSTRFDARRQLVLDDASAILRTYQRTQFLPEAQRMRCSELLREYVAVRISLPSLETVADFQAAVARSEGIQDELWAQAATLADRPNTILSGFMQSLSELTDLQMKRVRAAVWNRIPPTIVLMLYTIALLGMGTMGFGAGLVASRTMLPRIVLVLAFSAVIALIVDLERPRQKLFHISMEPMVAVERRILALPGPED